MSNETITRTAMGGADPRAAAVTSDTPGHFALPGELGAAKARIIAAATMPGASLSVTCMTGSSSDCCACN
jgi:hypothetical protein